ncbi:hypothetical protein, conserved [Eimeria brunetti]|uniref:Uncharacterized protein n=1 Tax=Eimeria brunetti TaxID=51314 RepID=U6LHQ5_9EIME|nr:hypothetical protein, conserved [Eimeria brunetti]
MPAVKAIGDMVKPIIDASGIEQEISDILAALNETSQNPFFILGIDDTPPQNAPLPTTPQNRHGTVQRQQLNGSKSPPPKTQPSQSKQKGSSLLPFRGLFTQEQGASATPPGPVDGVPSRKAPEKEHHPGHGEEEDDELLWRQWDKEDLDLL